MRQITLEAVNAFEAGRNFKKGNTEVKAAGGEVRMYLHGNLIAVANETGFYITNAGWQSNTTKERLNGLRGVDIYQKNWQWYLNGQPWNGELTEI